jgi:hypothetical protein
MQLQIAYRPAYRDTPPPDHRNVICRVSQGFVEPPGELV